MYSDEDVVSLALSQLLYNVDPNDTNEMGSRLARMSNEKAKKAADASLDQTQEIFKKMKAFGSITALVGQMNESYNSNKYIGDALIKEDARVSALNADLRKEIYKAQRDYLTTSFHRKNSIFKIYIVLFSALVVSLMAAIVALALKNVVPKLIAAIACLVVLGFFLISIIAFTRLSARRRQYHWKQFYWGIAEDDRKQLERECVPNPRALDKAMQDKIKEFIIDVKETPDYTSNIKRCIIDVMHALENGYLPSEIVLIPERMEQRMARDNSELKDRYDKILETVGELHRSQD